MAPHITTGKPQVSNKIGMAELNSQGYQEDQMSRELFTDALAYLRDHHWVFLATQSFASQQRTSRNRASPQTAGLPARSHSSPHWAAPQVKAYTYITSALDHFLYNEQKRDSIENGGEPLELSRDLGILQGWRHHSCFPAVVYVTLHTSTGWARCSGPPARSLQCVPRHHLSPFQP
ncbi:hypothetical protein PAL_GLEAN10011662 [Pteropus alecto]|uniref:Uncharacterized protein n=1 Tax=Pteropus alecto TaxID=9402 RepID=L5KHF9_PTEAL|nr:hypothetical protein PAL_GLEAN10011662 [Pteropus alecto]